MPRITPVLTLLLPALLLIQPVKAAEPATVTVRQTEHSQLLTLDGRLEAVKAATVSAQTSGRILKLYFDVNDRVPAGAALLEITSEEQGASLAAAEAEYARARALDTEAQLTLKRYQELFPKGAISRGQMDQAIANAKSASQAASAAKARIIQAKESLKYTVVSAPYAGIVTARHVEEGETVAPGQPLLSGFADDEMRVVMQLPQRFLQAAKATEKMTVILADGRSFDVTTPKVFGFSDEQSRAFQVRLPLPANTGDLLPGSFVKVRFAIEKRQEIVLPKEALYSVNELSAVYLKRGDNFVLQQVRLGDVRDDGVTILAGLEAGDIVAANAYRLLLEQRQAK
ncbi:efflux RND transporter periplasmic adaptor subunit [Shewanella algae]|uniref:efflux RND transporter periplasmic adaptor subunit n=1 Tax=Shewanella algae TaxID=38313 RepID=UPI002035438D|nr:efflux RND transporter periplasmic adaptor subunit [Shewanella algae]MCM2527759.1 efflux RND transporter periplasmic adaptor subunit [Shewanella algae]